MLVTADAALYVLPASWASALVKLNMEEVDIADQKNILYWVKLEDPGYCLGVMEKEPIYCIKHDASGIEVGADMCFTYVFQHVQ